MILIKNITVYSPILLGIKDVLISEHKIIKIDESITIKGLDVQVIDGTNKLLTPGFIDNHVHILGGGGENGPVSVVPEVNFLDFVYAGITSVVGLLGTDGISKTMHQLLVKVKALNHLGMSAYALTGSYQVPVKTMLNSIEEDLMYIEEIIGVGEIAISDHRSNHPNHETLIDILSRVHVGGLLSGKGGVLNLHIGAGKNRLKPIFELLDHSDLPVSKIIPTHINRNLILLDEGIEFSKKYDAYLDFTSYPDPLKPLNAASAIKKAFASGVSKTKVLMSSDGQGSLPVFNKDGSFKTMKIGKVFSLTENLQAMIKTFNLSIEDALHCVTKNVAAAYHLKGKGEIKEGYDADLVMLDKNFTIDTVWMNGKMMLNKKTPLVKETFNN